MAASSSATGVLEFDVDRAARCFDLHAFAPRVSPSPRLEDVVACVVSKPETAPRASASAYLSAMDADAAAAIARGGTNTASVCDDRDFPGFLSEPAPAAAHASSAGADFLRDCGAVLGLHTRAVAALAEQAWGADALAASAPRRSLRDMFTLRDQYLSARRRAAETLHAFTRRVWCAHTHTHGAAEEHLEQARHIADLHVYQHLAHVIACALSWSPAAIPSVALTRTAASHTRAHTHAQPADIGAGGVGTDVWARVHHARMARALMEEVTVLAECAVFMSECVPPSTDAFYPLALVCVHYRCAMPTHLAQLITAGDALSASGLQAASDRLSAALTTLLLSAMQLRPLMDSALVLVAGGAATADVNAADALDAAALRVRDHPVFGTSARQAVRGSTLSARMRANSLEQASAATEHATYVSMLTSAFKQATERDIKLCQQQLQRQGVSLDDAVLMAAQCSTCVPLLVAWTAGLALAAHPATAAAFHAQAGWPGSARVPEDDVGGSVTAVWSSPLRYEDVVESAFRGLHEYLACASLQSLVQGKFDVASGYVTAAVHGLERALLVRARGTGEERLAEGQDSLHTLETWRWSIWAEGRLREDSIQNITSDVRADVDSLCQRAGCRFDAALLPAATDCMQNALLDAPWYAAEQSSLLEAASGAHIVEHITSLSADVASTRVATQHVTCNALDAILYARHMWQMPVLADVISVVAPVAVYFDEVAAITALAHPMFAGVPAELNAVWHAVEEGGSAFSSWHSVLLAAAARFPYDDVGLYTLLRNLTSSPESSVAAAKFLTSTASHYVQPMTATNLTATTRGVNAVLQDCNDSSSVLTIREDGGVMIERTPSQLCLLMQPLSYPEDGVHLPFASTCALVGDTLFAAPLRLLNPQSTVTQAHAHRNGCLLRWRCPVPVMCVALSRLRTIVETIPFTQELCASSTQPDTVVAASCYLQLEVAESLFGLMLHMVQHNKDFLADLARQSGAERNGELLLEDFTQAVLTAVLAIALRAVCIATMSHDRAPTAFHRGITFAATRTARVGLSLYAVILRNEAYNVLDGRRVASLLLLSPAVELPSALRTAAESLPGDLMTELRFTCDSGLLSPRILEPPLTLLDKLLALTVHLHRRGADAPMSGVTSSIVDVADVVLMPLAHSLDSRCILRLFPTLLERRWTSRSEMLELLRANIGTSVPDADAYGAANILVLIACGESVDGIPAHAAAARIAAWYQSIGHLDSDWDASQLRVWAHLRSRLGLPALAGAALLHERLLATMWTVALDIIRTSSLASTSAVGGSLKIEQLELLRSGIAFANRVLDAVTPITTTSSMLTCTSLVQHAARDSGTLLRLVRAAFLCIRTHMTSAEVGASQANAEAVLRRMAQARPSEELAAVDVISMHALRLLLRTFSAARTAEAAAARAADTTAAQQLDEEMRWLPLLTVYDSSADDQPACLSVKWWVRRLAVAVLVEWHHWINARSDTVSASQSATPSDVLGTVMAHLLGRLPGPGSRSSTSDVDSPTGANELCHTVHLVLALLNSHTSVAETWLMAAFSARSSANITRDVSKSPDAVLSRLHQQLLGEAAGAPASASALPSAHSGSVIASILTVIHNWQSLRRHCQSSILATATLAGALRIIYALCIGRCGDTLRRVTLEFIAARDTQFWDTVAALAADASSSLDTNLDADELLPTRTEWQSSQFDAATRGCGWLEALAPEARAAETRMSDATCLPFCLSLHLSQTRAAAFSARAAALQLLSMHVLAQWRNNSASSTPASWPDALRRLVQAARRSAAHPAELPAQWQQLLRVPATSFRVASGAFARATEALSLQRNLPSAQSNGLGGAIDGAWDTLAVATALGVADEWMQLRSGTSAAEHDNLRSVVRLLDSSSRISVLPARTRASHPARALLLLCARAASWRGCVRLLETQMQCLESISTLLTVAPPALGCTAVEQASWAVAVLRTASSLCARRPSERSVGSVQPEELTIAQVDAIHVCMRSALACLGRALGAASSPRVFGEVNQLAVYSSGLVRRQTSLGAATQESTPHDAEAERVVQSAARSAFRELAALVAGPLRSAFESSAPCLLTALQLAALVLSYGQMDRKDDGGFDSAEDDRSAVLGAARELLPALCDAMERCAQHSSAAAPGDVLDLFTAASSAVVECLLLCGEAQNVDEAAVLDAAVVPRLLHVSQCMWTWCHERVAGLNSMKAQSWSTRVAAWQRSTASDASTRGSAVTAMEPIPLSDAVHDAATWSHVHSFQRAALVSGRIMSQLVRIASCTAAAIVRTTIASAMVNTGVFDALCSTRTFWDMEAAISARVQAGLDAYELFEETPGGRKRSAMAPTNNNQSFWATSDLMDAHMCTSTTAVDAGRAGMAASTAATGSARLQGPKSLPFLALGYGLGPATHRGYNQARERCMAHLCWVDTLETIATLGQMALDGVLLGESSDAARESILRLLRSFPCTLHTALSFRGSNYCIAPEGARGATDVSSGWNLAVLAEAVAVSHVLAQAARRPLHGERDVWTSWGSTRSATEAVSTQPPQHASLQRCLEYLVRDASLMLGTPQERVAGGLAGAPGRPARGEAVTRLREQLEFQYRLQIDAVSRSERRQAVWPLVRQRLLQKMKTMALFINYKRDRGTAVSRASSAVPKRDTSLATTAEPPFPGILPFARWIDTVDAALARVSAAACGALVALLGRAAAAQHADAMAPVRRLSSAPAFPARWQDDPRAHVAALQAVVTLTAQSRTMRSGNEQPPPQFSVPTGQPWPQLPVPCTYGGRYSAAPLETAARELLRLPAGCGHLLLLASFARDRLLAVQQSRAPTSRGVQISVGDGSSLAPELASAVEPSDVFWRAVLRQTVDVPTAPAWCAELVSLLRSSLLLLAAASTCLVHPAAPSIDRSILEALLRSVIRHVGDAGIFATCSSILDEHSDDEDRSMAASMLDRATSGLLKHPAPSIVGRPALQLQRAAFMQSRMARSVATGITAGPVYRALQLMQEVDAGSSAGSMHSVGTRAQQCSQDVAAASLDESTTMGLIAGVCVTISAALDNEYVVKLIKAAGAARLASPVTSPLPTSARGHSSPLSVPWSVPHFRDY